MKKLQASYTLKKMFTRMRFNNAWHALLRASSGIALLLTILDTTVAAASCNTSQTCEDLFFAGWLRVFRRILYKYIYKRRMSGKSSARMEKDLRLPYT
jgi:hypothetical protein